MINKQTNNKQTNKHWAPDSDRFYEGKLSAGRYVTNARITFTSANDWYSFWSLVATLWRQLDVCSNNEEWFVSDSLLYRYRNIGVWCLIEYLSVIGPSAAHMVTRTPILPAMIFVTRIFFHGKNYSLWNTQINCCILNLKKECMSTNLDSTTSIICYDVRTEWRRYQTIKRRFVKRPTLTSRKNHNFCLLFLLLFKSIVVFITNTTLTMIYNTSVTVATFCTSVVNQIFGFNSQSGEYGKNASCK